MQCCGSRCFGFWHSVHTHTNWNTCCHNTALLIMMYFYWLYIFTKV